MKTLIGTVITDESIIDHLNLPEGVELRMDLSVKPHCYRLYEGTDCILQRVLLNTVQLKFVVDKFFREREGVSGDGLVVDTTVPTNFGDEDIAPDDASADEYAGHGDSIASLSSYSHWQNADIADALKSIKNSENIERLQTGINDSREEIRQAVEDRLGKLEEDGS